MSSSSLFPLRRVITALVLAVGVFVSFTMPAGTTPPGIPNPAEAKGMLAALTIAPEGS